MAMNESSPNNAQADIDCPKKRLFVCCDGTWNDAVSTDSPLTNVARLSRCIKAVSSENNNRVLQIVYYQTGIGRGTSRIGRGVDGATGRGISTNIRDAYNFICHNFNKDKDEIYLTGFSRGAFTVCCLARLIKDIGILTKFGLSHLPELFRKWKAVMRKVNCNEDSPELKSLHSKVEQLGPDLVASRNVQIKALGIWDAVSALGIPIPLQIPQPKSKSFRSIHALIPDNVDHCYHALSLDEKRKHFKPVIWKSGKNSCPPRYRMKQCWFMGQHGDVGGGSFDGIWLSNLSLIWMMAHLTKAGADFDTQTLSALFKPAKPLLLNAARNNNKHGSRNPNSSVACRDENDYEVDSCVLPRNGTESSGSQQQQLTTTSTNASEDDICKKLRSEASIKKNFLRELKDLPFDTLYGFMGVRRRRPGKDTNCGELMHWSVRLLLREGHTTPALRNWAMVRDDRTPSWVPEEHLLSYYLSVLTESGSEMANFPKLEEDKVCSEEDELIKLWLEHRPAIGEQETDLSDPEGGKELEFFRANTGEMRNPRRLYVEPQKKSLMEEMDSAITRRRAGQSPQP
ncbi:hypothetical protein Daesc_002375 [Daldinia eschscholtzii]|uniref:T6SS Phospholipase effector Tle1-like catalytic domain-containing protein n=1 Tax=Daldinia eschscholtzii TaxID=292717 RepID=A0AAX6MWP8_9PEZI